MALESAKQFYKRFIEDEKFRLSLEKCKDDEARRTIRKNAGYEFSHEELKKVMGSSVQLTNGDLEAVAGGVNNDGYADDGPSSAAAAVI